MFLDETIMLKYALAFSFCVITVYCGVALEMTTVTGNFAVRIDLNMY